MKSRPRGKSTSTPEAEVVNVSVHGIWVLVHEREFFLAHRSFPWFRHATIDEIQNVELVRPGHLRWSDLDVDLELESLADPERYPLIYRK
ncbi:MAG: DUF2442 domain-containing protein [Deltaproteobacteria bacterium]|nr:DUF2442 domain-containing protein [Deltaproteobacteria bacterium]